MVFRYSRLRNCAKTTTKYNNNDEKLASAPILTTQIARTFWSNRERRALGQDYAQYFSELFCIIVMAVLRLKSEIPFICFKS